MAKRTRHEGQEWKSPVDLPTDKEDWLHCGQRNIKRTASLSAVLAITVAVA